MSDIDKTESYKRRFENSFEASMMFSAGVHAKLKSCNNVIIPSLAVNWELVGDQPKCVPKRLSKGQSEAIIDTLISKYCCDVNDTFVVDSVRESLIKSIKLKHLIYVYKNCVYSYRPRVRVICNQIWESYLVHKVEVV